MRSSQQNLHDQIRKFTARTYIVKARNAKMKKVSFTSDNVHAALSLVNRYPAVCRAIDTDIFKSENNVKLIDRDGPFEGPGVTWTFELL